MLSLRSINVCPSAVRRSNSTARISEPSCSFWLPPLRLFIVVEFALDPVDGAVEEIERAVSKRLIAHRLRRLLMLRLSRALVIQDLERLLEDSIIGRTEWSAKGVDCRRERHGYSSPAYSFDLDILDLHATRGPGGAWEVFIVTEFWRSAQGTTVHSPKWLKLIRGKPNDVLTWIAAHRDAEGRRKAPAAKA